MASSGELLTGGLMLLTAVFIAFLMLGPPGRPSKD
jgi:hypothetical protein